jgi:hypothetical protein
LHIFQDTASRNCQLSEFCNSPIAIEDIIADNSFHSPFLKIFGGTGV